MSATLEKCCNTCPKFQPEKEAVGECRARPPAASAMLIPQRGIGGDGLTLQVMSLFPRVQVNHWCAEHPGRIFDIVDLAGTMPLPD